MTDLSSDHPNGGGPPQRAFRLDIQFDGSNFEGWQVQPARPGEAQRPRTVQAVLEAAVQQITGQGAAALASGRTDAGVHAAHLVVRLRARTALKPSRLARAIDAVLPDDVGVLAACEVGPAFHPLRDATWKWYRYRILATRTKRPLAAAYAWHYARPVPFGGLLEAAAALSGPHDFASFGNRGSPRDGTVRTLHHVHWSREGDTLLFDVIGDGFLYKMVRTLVGTQIEAALSDDPTAAIRRVLEALDRRAAGVAAPGRGLTLMRVHINGDSGRDRLPPGLPPDVECLLLANGESA